ncbi:hypothetical protein JTE90_024430 [Oedothorax gibbosus]|uniref:Uncharacterized protein n=1 Tax=Oedothorax gibbosus TaxID=931172 RepID=A0AAV6UII7_9ARAC|nr:hypothetical protein JTE90_024430 [Oedothorax gibbosus]
MLFFSRLDYQTTCESALKSQSYAILSTLIPDMPENTSKRTKQTIPKQYEHTFTVRTKAWCLRDRNSTFSNFIMEHFSRHRGHQCSAFCSCVRDSCPSIVLAQWTNLRRHFSEDGG